MTRSTTLPLPAGVESHPTREPAAGQAPSSLTRWLNPSMNEGQRSVSYHSRSAAPSGPATSWMAATPALASGARASAPRGRSGRDGRGRLLDAAGQQRLPGDDQPLDLGRALVELHD